MSFQEWVYAAITGLLAACLFMQEAEAQDRYLTSSTDSVTCDLGANNDVTVSSSALPTGASTASNQSTLIGHVDGVEGLLTTPTPTPAAGTSNRLLMGVGQ